MSNRSAPGTAWCQRTIGWRLSSKRLTPGVYYPTGFIHFGDVPPGGGASLPNGAYILAGETGWVYVMAGGSPMYVSAWGAVDGPHPIGGTISQAQIDAMPARYPADGTAIRNYGTGDSRRGPP